jgi:RNA polymerase-binding transcription factor DksA
MLGYRRSTADTQMELIAIERRATRSRLAALERVSRLRERAALIGENTRSSEPMEEVQELIARDREERAREVLLVRLRALAHAEQRIREGTYGLCELCLDAIPAARLRVIPEAVRCVACAELAHASGRRRARRLSRKERWP